MSDDFQYTSYLQLTTCCINDYYDWALDTYRILTVFGGTRSFRVNRDKAVPSIWALSA